MTDCALCAVRKIEDFAVMADLPGIGRVCQECFVYNMRLVADEARKVARSFTEAAKSMDDGANQFAALTPADVLAGDGEQLERGIQQILDVFKSMDFRPVAKDD